MTFPGAIPSHFHVASHVSPTHVAPRSMRPCASSAPPRTCPPLHFNRDISPSTSTPRNEMIPAATPSCFHVASHVAPRSVRSCASSAPPRTRPPLHFNRDISPSTSTPHKKRSRRCFVCGGTDKHRLHPRFCPRTAELFAKGLVMFNFDLRLVSFDAFQRPARASHHSTSTSPGSSNLNPPDVPRVPRAPVAHHLQSAVPIANLNRPRTLRSPVEPPVSISSPDHCKIDSNPPHVAVAATIRPPTVEPNVDSNPPHASHAATVPRHAIDPSGDLDPVHAPHPSVVHPRTISSLDRSCESTLPHFPPVERLRSPPIYLPIRIPHPDSKPIVDLLQDDSSPHVTLTIFDILLVCPPIRHNLRTLIDAMDRLRDSVIASSAEGFLSNFRPDHGFVITSSLRLVSPSSGHPPPSLFQADVGVDIEIPRTVAGSEGRHVEIPLYCCQIIESYTRTTILAASAGQAPRGSIGAPRSLLP
ncbi:hypothetical protein B0H19DRAFT_1270699 [Mycena capillaripes]|nr:hypothetical protein B0H19DRAFT_1270699 [Mycena capillaripes]